MTIGIMICLSFNLYAECDTSTIKKTDDGYVYTKQCHLRVGELVYENTSKKEIIDLQEQLIQQQKNYIKGQYEVINELRKEDFPKWVFYGAGVISTIATVWAASRLGR